MGLGVRHGEQEVGRGPVEQHGDRNVGPGDQALPVGQEAIDQSGEACGGGVEGDADGSSSHLFEPTGDNRGAREEDELLHQAKEGLPVVPRALGLCSGCINLRPDQSAGKLPINEEQIA